MSTEGEGAGAGGSGGITKGAKKIEMELRARFFKAQIETRAESLEAEVLVKKRECNLVKEKEEISITTSASPAAIIGNFGNCANYAHMGEGTQAQTLASSYKHHIDWIIDSGASKHVTGMSSHFKSYSPYIHSECVRTADGTSQQIHGVGSIECTHPLTYHMSCMFLRLFLVNLILVSSIIGQFKCAVTFDENLCVFQERGIGRVIGTRVRHDRFGSSIMRSQH